MFRITVNSEPILDIFIIIFCDWSITLTILIGRKEERNATEIEEFLGHLAPELMKLLPQIQPTPTFEPVAEKYHLFESLTKGASSIWMY